MMNDSPETHSALLLTTQLGMVDRQLYPAPFSTQQWWGLCQRLRQQGLDASVLLDHPERNQRFLGSADVERILRLKSGRKLSDAIHALALDGIWLLGQTDAGYPACFRALGRHAPPVIYGVGALSLLGEDKRRLSIVGTRSAGQVALRYAQQLATSAAQADIVVVSGGAMGVDSQAHSAALNAGGGSVFVLPCGLLARQARQWLERITGNYVMISQVPPHTVASAATALARNRFIYSLGEETVVVSAHYQKGGSWKGAVDALEKNARIFVRDADEKGLQGLLERGAFRLKQASVAEL